MARYKQQTVARLLAKRNYSLHRNEKGFYTLIDPTGCIVREKLEALDQAILVYSKTIKVSYYALLEELESIPAPTPSLAEERARKKRRQPAKKQSRMYPLVPCPGCGRIEHAKNSKANSYKCLACGLKFFNNQPSKQQQCRSKEQNDKERNRQDDCESKHGVERHKTNGTSKNGNKYNATTTTAAANDRRIKDNRPPCPACNSDTLIRAGLDVKRQVRLYRCKSCASKAKVPLTKLTC